MMIKSQDPKKQWSHALFETVNEAKKALTEILKLVWIKMLDVILKPFCNSKKGENFPKMEWK